MYAIATNKVCSSILAAAYVLNASQHSTKIPYVHSRMLKIIHFLTLLSDTFN
jgi:hypothetical protein